MLIKYIGHACFKIRDNETGYSIVIDPYEPDSVPGFRKIVDLASEVLCTHDHFDHNYTDAIRIEPADESPYEVKVIETWHDDVKGAKRGPNKIYVIIDKKTGERLVHYGDIGEVMDDLLTEENMALLKDADVALIPVGGTYTYDADQALELISRTTPKIAVPMHFKSDTAGFGLGNIGSIEDFLNKAQKAGCSIQLDHMYFYDTAEYDLSNCILAIRPQNI
ncbi:MAG: MBL fold metallo-hydrolase [Mogibacterium sp.]|nr:MBL fold metallo-hydrolase [Mogibacterium sp.]MBR2540538.1 MBL fold metallo-hydrolase [Mogibacterium sp.]